VLLLFFFQTANSNCTTNLKCWLITFPVLVTQYICDSRYLVIYPIVDCSLSCSKSRKGECSWIIGLSTYCFSHVEQTYTWFHEGATLLDKDRPGSRQSFREVCNKDKSVGRIKVRITVFVLETYLLATIPPYHPMSYNVIGF